MSNKNFIGSWSRIRWPARYITTKLNFIILVNPAYNTYLSIFKIWDCPYPTPPPFSSFLFFLFSIFWLPFMLTGLWKTLTSESWSFEQTLIFNMKPVLYDNPLTILLKQDISSIIYFCYHFYICIGLLHNGYVPTITRDITHLWSY